MKVYAFRCDMCGVFHRLYLEEEELKVENFSGILYEVVTSEEIEDVQTLNNSEGEEDADS